MGDVCGVEGDGGKVCGCGFDGKRPSAAFCEDETQPAKIMRQNKTTRDPRPANVAPILMNAQHEYIVSIR